MNPDLKPRWRRWLFHPVLWVYIVLTFVTRSNILADTHVYVDAILRRYANWPDLPFNPFWDFGHVLLRPSGWLLLKILRPVLDPFTGHDVRLDATICLFILAWISGLFSAFFVFFIARSFTRRDASALAITGFFLCVQSVLIFVQSGTFYIPGLMFLLWAVWVLVSAIRENRLTPGEGFKAGWIFAVSVCCWFPYVLMGPAFLSLLVLLPGSETVAVKDRVRVGLASILAAGIASVLIYLAPIVALGIRTPSELIAWISGAGHGWSQNRTGIRIVFGLPRSFIYMGSDGTLFKRFLFHDPYAPVSLMDLVRLTLLKLGAFYLFALALGVALIRSAEGRRLLGIAAVAMAPMLFFAIVLFEPGSIERYLPVLPFLLMAIAWLIANGRSYRIERTVVVAFAMVMAAANLYHYSWFNIGREERSQMARIEGLKPVFKPNSLLALPTLSDGLIRLAENFPFNPVNREGWLQSYCIAEIGTARIDTWRQDFTAKTLATWNAGGDLWIAKRLLAQRPEPEWGWTEGDDRRIAWKDLYSFFSRFELGQSVGGADGFTVLLPNEANRRMIEEATGTKPLALLRSSPD